MHNSDRLLRPPQQDITVIETNVERIATMERKALLARSPGARLIDILVGLGGTPLFALGHVVWFGCWIVANVAVVNSHRPSTW